MKAILKFDFEDDVDLLKFRRMHLCDDIIGGIHDFDQYLRTQYKYNDELPEEQSELYFDIRQKLHDFLIDSGVNLNALVF